MRPGQWALRAALVVLFLSLLLFADDLFDHFRAHFTGAIEGDMIKGQWHIVVLNIIVFCAFLIPLSFRRKVDWKEYGLVAAFFISLFVEMYGLPLTIALGAGLLPKGYDVELHYAFEAEFLGVGFAFTLPMLYGTALMLIGTAFVIAGWMNLYTGLKKRRIVTSGIYSVSRHPQYFGFILIVAGWMVGWPTPLTLLFSVILIIVYVRVAKKEELGFAGDRSYGRYRKNVPFML